MNNLYTKYNNCIFNCSLCERNYDHQLNKCFIFIEYKRLLSRYNYFSYSLKYNDRLGFCSSSILLYYMKNNKMNIFMIKEERNNKLKFNFPGGKREWGINRKNNIYYMESYKQTALREFIEELREIYSLNTLYLINKYIKEFIHKNSRVLWIADNKMVYNIIEIPENLALSNNNNAAWFEVNDLINNNFINIFDFSKEAIIELKYRYNL